MRRTLTLVISVLMTGALAIPAVASEPDATYLDKFSAQGYNGNDGTLDFPGPWVEISESNGTTEADVWVWDHPGCDGAFCLKMGGSDPESAGHGAYRKVDLSNVERAELSFDYGRELLALESNGKAVVQVSPDSGSSWTTLKTIDLDDADDGVSRHKKFDITEWAGEDTVIRFMITEADEINMYWLIDNVMVEVTFAEASPTTTTTTRAATTTTSTTSTTSTTTPKETTTTSKPKERVVVEATTTTTLERTIPTTVPATTTTGPAVIGDEISPVDRATMMQKTSLAIVSSMPASVMPESVGQTGEATGQHAEPVEALAAAFFTDAGNYGGNLLPSVALGVVIAVVMLLGIGSRRED